MPQRLEGRARKYEFNLVGKDHERQEQVQSDEC